MTRIKKLGALALLSVALCILMTTCMALFSADDPPDADLPTLAPQVLEEMERRASAPAPTLGATDAPEETATPTSLPVVTATPPIPTPLPPTQTPRFGPADVAYAQTMIEPMERFSFHWLEVHKLLNEVGTNPLVLTDPEWILEIGVQIGFTQGYIHEIQNVTPSENMQETHDTLSQALDYYDQGLTKLTLGFDNLDPDLINEAGQLIQRGNVKFSLAKDLLDEILEAAGG